MGIQDHGAPGGRIRLTENLSAYNLEGLIALYGPPEIPNFRAEPTYKP